MKNCSYPFWAVLLAFFSIPATISGVATLGVMLGQSFDVSLTEIQWVFTLFLLCSAGLTVSAGKLAGNIGKFRVFIIGAFVLSIASFVSALSSNFTILLVARGIAGGGAAALLATGPAILSSVFQGDERNIAFSWFGTAVGSGLAFGPLLTAIIMNELGWKSVFFAHSFIFFSAAVIMLPAKGQDLLQKKMVPFDTTKAILQFITLFSISYVVIEGPVVGLTNQTVLYFSGVALLGIFLMYVRKRKVRSPKSSQLTQASFWAWSVSAIFPSFTFFVFLLYMPTYLFVVFNLEAIQIGWYMAALTLPMVLFPLSTNVLLRKGFSSVFIFAVASTSILIGMAHFILFVSPEKVQNIIYSFFLIGSGTGILFSLTDSQALQKISDNEVSQASGIINTLRLGSEAIAAAAYGSIFWLAVQNWAHQNPDILSMLSQRGPSDTMLSELAVGKLSLPSNLAHFGSLAFHSAFKNTIVVMGVLGLSVVVITGILFYRDKVKQVEELRSTDTKNRTQST